MVERFYVTVIFLLMKALLPLRSEKARPLPLKKNSQLSERHIHKQLANTALLLYMILGHQTGAVMRTGSGQAA